MAHHTYRAIPLNGGPHIPEPIKLWMGDSRGRWDGNSLVVDVTNNNDQPWFDVVGTFHSDAMRVTERFVPIDADTIELHLGHHRSQGLHETVDDEADLQAHRRITGPSYEEACLENNERTLELMLTEARALTRACQAIDAMRSV